MPPHCGEKIAERGLRSGIPGSLPERNSTIRVQRESQEHHHAVQSEETGGAAFNRQVRPLALPFHSQMRPALFEGDLDGLARDCVFYDRCCALRRIGREVRLGFPLALRITGEHEAGWAAGPSPWKTTARYPW